MRRQMAGMEPVPRRHNAHEVDDYTCSLRRQRGFVCAVLSSMYGHPSAVGRKYFGCLDAPVDVDVGEISHDSAGWNLYRWNSKIPETIRAKFAIRVGA